MIDTTTSTAEWTLFALAVLSVLLSIVGQRMGMPLFLLIGRWVRWILFAGIFTFFLKTFEISYRPDWVHFITGLGLWFLLETGYNWIAIKALSRSEMPLFPSFQTNSDGDEWPADEHLIGLRDWLRLKKFTRLSALKAKLFEDTYLRASIYESADKLTRLQILFIPKRKGGATACYTLSTNAKDERRLITDNLFLPFGGYYPEGWNLCRKPLIGSLQRLLALHHKRLIKSTLKPIPFEDTPLEELNEQQRVLERLNLETGFLVPRQFQEEEGKISYDGRYRLWKEMWLIAYLGRSVS
jgi:hypothetical protein